MIDKKTGAVYLAPDKAILPLMAPSLLKDMQLGEYLPYDDKGNGWAWYPVHNIKTRDWCLNCNFGFYEHRLMHISMALNRPGIIIDPDDPWRSWSEEEEKQNAEILATWLDTEIGRRRKFAWGSIRAGYDVRSLSSAIEIGYIDAK